MSLTEDLLPHGWDDEPVRLVVRWDPMRTSQNRRLHWSDRNDNEQSAKAVGRHAWAEAGFPRFAVPVRVSLTVRRAKAMDLWNLPGGVKGLVDGLFHDALTPTDAPQWIAEIGYIRQEVGPQYRGREECEFLVEPLPLPAPGSGKAAKPTRRRAAARQGLGR